MLEDVIKAQQAGLPTFPVWPPPSGGLPVVTPELGPILSPTNYGQGQTSVINVIPALVWPLPAAAKGTFFPHAMPAGANGANQKQLLPAWPWPSKMEAGPLKASSSLSKIP